MMTQENIGKYISALRKEKGLTQEQLAEKLGVTNRSVSRWENGKTMPDFSMFPVLCEVLEVSVSELLTGEKLDHAPEMGKTTGLIIELLECEQQRKTKVVNQYLILSAVCLGAVLLQSQFGIPEFVKAPRELNIVIGILGFFCLTASFYYNNQNRKYTEREVSVFLGTEVSVKMKTAGEMLQYAKRSQKAELKQYEKAFQAIEKELLPEEAVRFSMVADTVVENKSWEDGWRPWHVGLAVTDSRILVCGEAVHGRFMTFYDVGSYETKDVCGVTLQNRKIVIGFSDKKLYLEAKNPEAVMEPLKKVLNVR